MQSVLYKIKAKSKSLHTEVTFYYAIRERVNKVNIPQMAGVSCNQCNERFRIMSIQAKLVKDDIEKNYFDCPHCNSEYLVSYTDTSIRALQKKIQKSLAKIGNANYDKAAAHKMLRKQRQKLAADMTALRARIEASS